MERVKEDYLNSIMNENTFKSKKQWLTKFIRGLSDSFETNTSTVTKNDINRCLQGWWKQYENSNSYNLGRQTLISFIKWGIDEGVFQFEVKISNIVGRKKNNQIPKSPYTDGEIQRFIATANNTGDLKYIVLIALFTVIAPRASEVANLKWKDVFHNKEFLYFLRKGGEVQELAICNALYHLLKTYYEYRNRPNYDSYLFATENKQIPDRFKIYAEMKFLADKANVRFRGVHIFRNNLANAFDEMNVQNSVFLKNFSWKDERMKQKYINSNDDKILQDIQRKMMDELNIMEDK